MRYQNVTASTFFRPICNANEGTVSSKGKEYPQRLSVQVTDAMDNRLEQVARGRDEAKSEVVRTALRAFLDEQEDVIGSRKHFTKAFGRRVDQLERLLSVAIYLNLETLHMFSERLRQKQVDRLELLSEAIDEGVGMLEALNGTLEDAAADLKAKPPA